MQTITKYLALIMLSLGVQLVNAQDTIQNVNVNYKIEALNEERTKIELQEKEHLKREVEVINQRMENGEITQEDAELLKKKHAEKRVLNIENRLSIIDNKIELLKRNEEGDILIDVNSSGYYLRIGGTEDENTNDEFIYFGKKDEDKPRRFDRRTTNDLVFAIGFNNALIEGEKLDDSPYKLAGSGFVELGWAWKTRLLKKTNALRLKYGFSFMWNKLDIKDNKYFVNTNGDILLETYPTNLKKVKFRTTNLVFPVHFEFGPSKKIERDTYFRYSTKNQFKVGLGGYGGFNLSTLQKLKYKLDGRNVKDKDKGGFNTSNLIYGLSGYIAFDDVALYVKYDLSPIFKDQAIDQNNISLGLRFDMD